MLKFSGSVSQNRFTFRPTEADLIGCEGKHLH